jgi:hypothetical protein
MSVDFGSETVVGGTTLIIPAVQSPNFLAGSMGWMISADGTAQFNEIVFGGNTPTEPTNPDGIALIIDSFGNIIGFNDYGAQVFILNPSANQFIIYQDLRSDVQGPVIFAAAGQTFADPFGNTIQAGVTIGATGIVPATPPAGQMVLYLDSSGNLLAVTSAGNTRTIAAV